MPPISLYEGPFPLPRIRAARPALRTTLPPDSLCPHGGRRSWALRVVVPPEGRSPMASRLRLNPRHAQGRIRLKKSVKQASVESGCWRVRSSRNRHTRSRGLRCHGRRMPDSYRVHRAESRSWCISWPDSPLPASLQGWFWGKAVDSSVLSQPQPIGSARGRGARLEGCETRIAARVHACQRVRLRSDRAQPGSIRFEGLEAFLWKRDPALLGKTPAATMQTTITQHHTIFLCSRAKRVWSDGKLLRREV